MSADRPLSIAIVLGSMSRLSGGLFNSVRRSALELAQQGHDVQVLAQEDAHSEEDIGAWEPLKPLVAKRKGPATLGYAPQIGQKLKEGHFDVVHQHGIWQALSLQSSSWRKATGGPVMVSPRGMLDPWALSNSRWKKKLAWTLTEKANLTNAKCLHALNASEAESMRAFGLTNPIATIPNGADLPPQHNVAPPQWWPGGKVLLFIGRIHPKKGVAELVEAFAQFASSEAGEGWNCVIAGWDDGGHLDGLRNAIAHCKMEDRIVLPGPLYGEEKEAALRSSSAFILPSYSEGLPMSVLEAWAYRLPVLMTRECNLPEGFCQGAAIQITPRPAALAQLLEKHLHSSAQGALRVMGEQGRSLVEARFSWAQIARAHAEVYRWMCGISNDLPQCISLAGERAE